VDGVLCALTVAVSRLWLVSCGQTTFLCHSTCQIEIISTYSERVGSSLGFKLVLSTWIDTSCDNWPLCKVCDKDKLQGFFAGFYQYIRYFNASLLLKLIIKTCLFQYSAHLLPNGIKHDNANYSGFHSVDHIITYIHGYNTHIHNHLTSALHM